MQTRALSGVIIRGAVACVASSVTACSPSDLSQGPPSTVTAFGGARIITGREGDVIDDGVFIVTDDRISHVGPRGRVDVPEGAVRVDLRGRTVIPALVNTHIHLPSSRDSLVEQLRLNAYFGVGTVVSLGEDFGEVPFQVRSEVIPGAARYLTAGRGITRPEPGRSEVPYWINTQEEARQAVIELAAQPVDIVKIWVDDWGGRYEELTPRQYGAIIDEAHRHGLRVTAHIVSLEDAKNLVRAGVDAFAHGVRDRDVDEEFLALLRERPQVVYVPNLPDPGVERDWSWLVGTVPPDELERLRSARRDPIAARDRFALEAGNLARLTAAGTRIAFGTDGSSGWNAHFELEDMVAAGMTPSQAIAAATRSSAELMQLEDVGTIAHGKIADFVILGADPLDDIRHTRTIETVYLRGTPVDRRQ